METSFIAQPYNILAHFLALEMCAFLHRSAMKTNLSVYMIQQLCGHQTCLRAVFVYVCWSRVLLQTDPLSWTGLRFEAHPLECWTAPPPSVHSPVVQNVQELTLHRLAVVNIAHEYPSCRSARISFISNTSIPCKPATCFIGCAKNAWVDQFPSNSSVLTMVHGLLNK